MNNANKKVFYWLQFPTNEWLLKEPNEVESKNQSKHAFLQIHERCVLKLYIHD
jgi:hypothetical protein